MRSRYDLMKKSSQKASDGTFYPDIMTFKINRFKYNESPTEHNLTEIDFKRKDILVFNFYGFTEFDDIILWLNKISYIYLMNIGDSILIPNKIDIEEFFVLING